jgi:predicted dehydrogenase
MKPFRVAVVGAGRLGGFHAQKLAARDDVTLCAVADPVAESRERLAAQCHARPVADYRELFDEAQAVVIAAPSRLHREIGLDFLRRGVHVLMEKPLAVSAAEADELVAAARSAGAVLQVGHVERFNPALAAALPHLDRPKYIEAVRAGAFSFRSTDVGVVLDLMIHDIDLVLSLVREPVVRVEAIGLSVLGGHEDVANARLYFADGAVAALSACRVAYEAARRMQVWSARAFASIDFNQRTATVVRPSETLLGRRLNLDAMGPQELEHCRQHLMEEHLPQTRLTADAVDALALEQDDFLASIRTPRAPRVTGQQARDAVAVAEQVLEAIHAHPQDDVEETPSTTRRPQPMNAPHFQLSAMREPVKRRAAG